MYKFSSAGGPRFPAAVATHLNEYFQPHEPLVGNDIGVTSAATALHEVLAYSLAEPGEGILTSRPFYGRFELDFGNKSQLKVVCPETRAETCFQPDVVEAFEKALVKSNTEGVKIRALLVVNPHNPLGEKTQGRVHLDDHQANSQSRAMLSKEDTHRTDEVLSEASNPPHQ